MCCGLYLRKGSKGKVKAAEAMEQLAMVSWQSGTKAHSMMSWNSRLPADNWLATPLGTCSATQGDGSTHASAWHSPCNDATPKRPKQGLTQLPNSGLVIMRTKELCPSRHLQRTPHELTVRQQLLEPLLNSNR